MSGLYFSSTKSKGSSFKAQRAPQTVTLSVDNYINDKLHYGVPVKRSDAVKVDPNLGGSLQTQPIDINMDYQPYRTGRCSISSIEDNASSSASDFNFNGSEYSSDAESGMTFQTVNVAPPQQQIQYDAQRTSAFSQAATQQSANEKKKIGSPSRQRRSMVGGNSKLSQFVPSTNRLRLIWKRHKSRIVLMCILVYFVGFTAYDVYFTTKQQEQDAIQAGQIDPDSDEHRSHLKQKSMFETDPDLLLDDQEQRRRETEAQLTLQSQDHKSLSKQTKSPSKLLKKTQGHYSTSRSHGKNNHGVQGIYTGYQLKESEEKDKSCSYVKLFGSLEQVHIHDEILHDQRTLTYDSEHSFCDVSDLDYTSQCCDTKSQIDRDFHESCNENTGCCASMPDCVAHCSFVNLHEQFLKYNTRDEELLLDLSVTEKRDLFNQCEKQCRIDSKSVNHNRYFNDDYQKYCHNQPLAEEISPRGQVQQNPSKVKTVLAMPDESCNAACSRLDEDHLSSLPGHKDTKTSHVQRPTPLNDHSKMHPQRVETLSYQCSVPELHKLNSCELLKFSHGCTECSIEFESFGPAFLRQEEVQAKTSTSEDSQSSKTDLSQKRQLNEAGNGECLVASHGMLLNCDNASPDFVRICPCVPLPMKKKPLVKDNYLPVKQKLYTLHEAQQKSGSIAATKDDAAISNLI